VNSEFRDAVMEMRLAAMNLRPYIQHTCTCGSDTPLGDFCFCGRKEAIDRANNAIQKLMDLVKAGGA